MIKYKVEKAYGFTANKAFKMVNPIKKILIKTQCLMHRFLNQQALEILKKEGYLDEYNFYKNYIDNLNEGVTWADQDFRSINHFFHYKYKKGLFGFSNALQESKKFYNLSLKYLKRGEIKNSMFYLGACCHLIQDCTVPHHVNNKLLKQHRRFEQWIITEVIYNKRFFQLGNVIKYDNLESYIINNAENANATYMLYKDLLDLDNRYYNMANNSIYRAKGTTAGFLITYYNTIVKKYWANN